MNLFQRLLFRRLCNEQPADGGAGGGGAPSDASGATATDQSQGNADQQPGAQAQQKTDDGAEQPKKDEEKPGEKKDENKKPEGAPEKYELTAGEGVELDAAAVKEFEPIARELNLSNEQAQKLVDVYASKILPLVNQQQLAAWQKQGEEWQAAIKADKEIGGDKLTSSISAAQRAIDQFGTPELKEYLEASGLGNNPALVRFCVQVGKAMSEDNMVTGGNQGQRSAAEVLYGN
ncbi:peptidase [Cronobacter dublinensis]|uniref:peptidase n=1 Tax=Cronobacter dublinensis TaxID=413497 RepID=UPI000CFD1BED|nr:peptidase [Cronobacter dublinensis]